MGNVARVDRRLDYRRDEFGVAGFCAMGRHARCTCAVASGNRGADDLVVSVRLTLALF